jgi:signal transduction histidine kinase
MKLFPKFLTVFLAAALGPLAFVGLRLVRETERSLRDSALSAQGEIALRAAEAVRHRLDKSETLLSLARLDPALLGKDEGRRRAALASLLATDDLMEEASVHDAVGRLLARAGRAPRAPAFPEPDWGAVRSSDLTKAVVRGPTAGRPPVMTWHAVLGVRPGIVDGFLTAHLRADGLAATLTDALPGPSSGLSLFDEKGGTLAEAGAVSTGGVQTRVPVSDGGWTLKLVRSSNLVFEAVGRARRRLAWALSWTALAAVLACLWLAGRLTRPLRALGEAVRRMKEGDFQAPIPRRTGDELGDLSADLREAQTALEKRARDAVLGRMARMIGHDLRAPLDIVGQMLGPLDAADPRRAKIARDALSDARDFAEQMLTVGRDQPPSFQLFDLNALVRDVIQAPSPDGFPAVKAELDEKLPPLRIDPLAVRRALANVVKNAREAAKSRVVVRTEAEDGMVSVIVVDDGPGIPEEKKDRLFEEFSTKPGGAGLGLLVVKKVMDGHDGRVRIANSPGGGAMVRLEFPRA